MKLLGPSSIYLQIGTPDGGTLKKYDLQKYIKIMHFINQYNYYITLSFTYIIYMKIMVKTV